MRALSSLLVLLCACTSVPRPGPFRRYTCDVPVPEWAAECPPDAHLRVVIVSDEDMEATRRAWYPQWKEVNGLTLQRHPRAYDVIMSESRASLRLLKHEVRCHVRAYLDPPHDGNFEHRAMPDWDCAND